MKISIKIKKRDEFVFQQNSALYYFASPMSSLTFYAMSIIVTSILGYSLDDWENCIDRIINLFKPK